MESTTLLSPTVASRTAPSPPAEADGLAWSLRLAVLCQRVAAGPLRRTQTGEFFKRDHERLTQDAILTQPPAESLAEVRDPALLAVALAEVEGVTQTDDGEV